MNQAELTTAVAERSGQSKTVVTNVLGAVAEEIQAALSKGGEAVLPHLGKLKTVARAARVARNPKTGESVDVPARTAVKFSVAKDLRDALPKPKGKKK